MSNVVDFVAAHRAAHWRQAGAPTNVAESSLQYAEAQRVRSLQTMPQADAFAEVALPEKPCRHLVDHPVTARLIRCGNAARITICDDNICEEHASPHRAACRTCALAEAAAETSRALRMTKSRALAASRRERRLRLGPTVELPTARD